ncbi:class I SAM-dependent methyltransferase [Amycolatopsis alkalitolerans]|uniref:Class I SAM-dependent methyltransferase n=1 Tax=Amycolatopsis alkalitolerans TaxID=2547244 RepID=A0A5C4LWJ4_9PSEU|nr:class I SAM-dependent methyltransferase [Amycolatopsis alkalitolerans]TNC21013.1 class I SAM-dependent methyltransferase [Amycolatopsis alkalitolerans]
MDDADAMQAHYALGQERDRLITRARGVLEAVRTKEIALRHLPDPPATIADIGGGPGHNAVWLAGLGYRVEHRDLMPLHVAQPREECRREIRTAVADARDLDLADASVDAVLLLGPLYHLRRREDRLRALGEARRVVRPGGPVLVAAISRWAPRLDGELRLRLYERYPQVRAETTRVERTGWLPPLFPGSFTGYCHRPRQLRAELRDAGLSVLDLVAVEGMAFMLADLDERMNDPRAREVVLDAARALERVPELLGAGGHLPAVAKRLN